MKEYVLPEAVIQKRAKATAIYQIIYLLIMIGMLTIKQLYKNLEVIFSIIFGIFIILSVATVYYISLKLEVEGLRSIKLILDEDFLIWVNKNSRTYKIDYLNIKNVKLQRNKDIVIKLKNSLRKVYIPNYINDVNDIFIYLQSKVSNQ